MRLKPVLVALAALVALGLVIWRVDQATHRTFGGHPAPARLAHATPAYQNGLTLMEIDNVSPDRDYDFSEGRQNDRGGSSTSTETDTGLWIKLPPSVPLPPGCSSENYSPCRSQLTLTARASDGRELPLRWRSSSSRSNNDPVYILASIPAGYPDGVRWADVTLEDHHGDTAKWRILHLPPMQHVLAPPVALKATLRQGSISVTVDAYRGADPLNHRGPKIFFDVRGAIVGAAHCWELGHITETDEWEPPNFVPQDAGYTMGTNKAGSRVSLELTHLQIGGDRPEPYISDDRWVRLDAQLQEFETYDETVTFHNVSVMRTPSGVRAVAGPTAQTVTSPSGIIVTLVDVQNQKGIPSFVSSDPSVRLAYPQTRMLLSLPKSPLWRRYKRPLTLSADFALPVHGSSSSQSDKEGTYAFRSDKPLPKVIANFPVIIRQRVDLRTVPMTFTLPVLGRRRPNPATSRASSLLGKGGHKAQ